MTTWWITYYGHSDDSIGVIYDRNIFIILAAGVWVDSYPCWQILDSDENPHIAASSVMQRERERERERKKNVLQN
jgi:hypothetical protein